MMRFVKRLLGSRWLKWAVVVIAVGIGAYTIDGEWNQVHHALGQIGLLACFEALLALLVMQFATLREWQALLAGLGSPLRTTTAGRIFFIGQLGKYIPGSLWPVLTQMELGARANVPRARSASASILTMILSLATGLLLAAATLPFAHYSAGYDWVFILVPVILVCLYPRVLNPLLNWLFKLTKRPGLDQPVTLRMLSKPLAWSLLAWIANGAQIWILAEQARRAGRPDHPDRPRRLRVRLVRGLRDHLRPGRRGHPRGCCSSPRLAPVLGAAPALAVALVSRAVNTISDLLVAGAAAFRRPRLSSQERTEDVAPVSADPVSSKLT